MKRGPYHTLSGWPIGSDADMAFHRATGEQIPKSEPVILDTEHYLTSGRTVITVGSYADLDKLAELDLPEGVEVVVTSTPLPDGWDGVVINPPNIDMSAMTKAASAMAALMPAFGKAYMAAEVMARAMHPAWDGYTYTHTGKPADLLILDESADLKPMAWDYPLHGHSHTPLARWVPRQETGKWRGRDREFKLRVKKNRARNKAARKARGK